jgi:hypothetical protein
MRLAWTEEEVIDYNIFARRMGCNGPWRSEDGIIKAYAGDIAIFRASIMHSR